LATIRLNDKAFKSALKNLNRWAKQDADKDLKNAADEVTKSYKSLIMGGMDGSGRSMEPIKDSTLNMPIRFSSDPAIRKTVRSSKKPLVARGHAVGSLKRSSKKGIHSIEPSTKHGKKVFGFNAEKAKTKRDPLIVSDVQGKIIERHLIKGLSQAIRG
jgi:ribosomal protein S6E (S10)